MTPINYQSIPRLATAKAFRLSRVPEVRKILDGRELPTLALSTIPSSFLSTGNSKLKTQDSKLKTPNSQLSTGNSKLKTQNSKLKTFPSSFFLPDNCQLTNMRHSLLSKFQGALLGAAVGDCLGVQYQNQLLGMQVQTDNWQPILKLTKHQQLSLTGAMLGLHSANGKLSSSKIPSECGRLAVAGAQSLIRCGSLDIKDWRNTWGTFIKLELYDSGSKDFQTILNPSECAIAALPAVLFFHENRVKLREKLLLATEVGDDLNASEWQMGALAAGYPIARAIKERLNPATAISQTITYLKTENALTELLSHVQVLLERGADLETAATQLYKTAKMLGEKSDDRDTKAPTKAIVNPANLMPIALAFYCFLSTPEDWRLSVIRAARCGIAGQLTCALTGALSGAYNGIAAIPVEWRQALSVAGVGPRSTEGRESSLWGTERDRKIVELATQLFAVWAGVYSPDTGSEPSAQTPVVTAPYVIRPHKI